VAGGDLTVDQSDTPAFDDLNQFNEGYFRCIRCVTEHGFAKEDTALGDSVQSTNEFGSFPGFHGVRMTQLV
jgi:hypothetical protein